MVLRCSSSSVIVIVHFISFYPLLGHFNFADLGLYYFAATQKCNSIPIFKNN